ncbi:dual specificity phosphatase 28 [Hippocampus comes]|uniref:Dual specificity phosphatase 28 n=1 Tax=Hippocampus comes TaxID=109280 RepID=A0A3Q2XYB6_HIPCM|nr:PREDICTED: dual specificity phosphatase 28-like [Hippocampus comes]XP_019730514.1 PREDICTED: dual specificity phosphatase 28-like [Hippocampus comes]
MQPLSQVTNSLAISNARAACSPDLLQREAVTLCINVTRRQPFPDAPVTVARVAVSDRPEDDLYSHLDACADAIHAEALKGGRSLVYCKNGRSRSAAVCVAYLMKHQQMALADALKKVKAARPVIAPNPGFLAQLQRYEDELRTRRDSQPSQTSSSSPNPENPPLTIR